MKCLSTGLGGIHRPLASVPFLAELSTLQLRAGVSPALAHCQLQQAELLTARRSMSASGNAATSVAVAEPEFSNRDGTQRMTRDDLRAYLDSHPDLHKSCQLVRDAGKSITDGDVVKSLVLMVNGAPWVAVVRGQDRLDERRVADLVHVARRRVRLATREETLLATGFVPGTVPPLGHKVRLPTLVDVAVTRISGPVYGGGGDEDTELVVDVPTLLAHTTALVVDIAAGVSPARGSSPPPAPRSHPSSPAQSQQGSLPLPWAPGARVVDLVAVVAAKRRVAKLLQFCPLLPENSSAIATIAGATLEDKLRLRRAWRNPGSPSQWSSESYELAGMDPSLAAQQPAGSQQGSSTSSGSDQHPVDSSCEVQLIMGKTLERNLGREAAIDLMDRIRPGHVIRVIGTTQPHGPPPGYVPTPGASLRPGAPPSATQPQQALQQQQQGQQQHQDQQPQQEHQSQTAGTNPAGPKYQGPVLDVIAHQVTILYKRKQRLERDLLRAQRAGFNAASAADLLRLATLNQAGSTSNLLQQSSQTVQLSMGSLSDDEEEGEEEREGEVQEAVANGVVPAGRQQGQQRGSAGDALHQYSAHSNGVAAPGHPAVQGAGVQGVTETTADMYWSMPARTPVAWVGDVAGVQAMCEYIQSRLPSRHQQHQPDNGASAEHSRLQELQSSTPLLVGIDMEWRAGPQTPVAVVQVALQDHVFLVDAIALGEPCMHGTRALLSDSDGQASSSQLTPQQQSLADLMSLLLLNPDQIALLGFQLNTDVARLDSTFPWLHAVLARYQGSSLDDATSATATVEHDAEQSQQSALLRSARVTKVVEGVEVSYVEMTSLARSADPERFLLRMGGPHTLSLSRLTQEVLGKPLDKSIRSSDWEARPLSQEQQTYAATDAHVLVTLCKVLLGMQ